MVRCLPLCYRLGLLGFALPRLGRCAPKPGAARTRGGTLAGGATRIRGASGSERPRAAMSAPASLPDEIWRLRFRLSSLPVIPGERAPRAPRAQTRPAALASSAPRRSPSRRLSKGKCPSMPCCSTHCAPCSCPRGSGCALSPSHIGHQSRTSEAPTKRSFSLHRAVGRIFFS